MILIASRSGRVGCELYFTEAHIDELLFKPNYFRGWVVYLSSQTPAPHKRGP